MKINHLNGNSKMRFRLLNESVSDGRGNDKPLARIAVDGTFFVDLTMQDIAEILAQGGLKAQDFFDVKPIGKGDRNII